MKKVIIVGAGGHAAELDDYIRFSNKAGTTPGLQIAGFIDDNAENYNRYRLSAPMLGDIRNHIIREDCEYLIGIANLEFRRMIVERFLSAGAVFISYIHPDAYISESAEIGRGVVISYLANIGPNASIGDFTVVNARASVAHDSRVGSFNFIGPNVCLSGFTEAGDENLFGVNSATIPGVKIGSRNKIAAGVTLHRKITDGNTVFYKITERIIVTNKTSSKVNIKE